MPLKRKHQIAAKLETAEGVDPWAGGGGIPAAADVIKVFDPDVQDAVEFQSRPVAGSSLSKDFDAPGRQTRTVTFRSDWAGNTTGATPDDKRNALPEWDALIQASGFKRVDLTMATATVTSGPFYIGERVEVDANNWGIAMNAATGAAAELMIAVVAGTFAGAAAITGIQSGAGMATPTIDLTGGRGYRFDSLKTISVDLTAGGWSGGGAPAAGDVILIIRAGEQVGSALVVTVADPIILSTFYGGVLDGDTLRKANGDSATVEASNAVLIVSGPSMGLYSNLDSLVRKTLGTRGDFTLSADVGNVFEFAWTFSGNALAAFDATQVAGVALSSLQGPRFQGAAFGIGYDRGGGSYFDSCIPIKNLEFAAGITTQDRRSPCAASGVVSAQITDREPQITFEVDQVGVVGFDWGGLLGAGTPMRLGLRIGSVVGNRLALAMPNGQVTDVADSEADGLATHQVTVKPRRIREAGDDEIFIAKF